MINMRALVITTSTLPSTLCMCAPLIGHHNILICIRSFSLNNNLDDIVPILSNQVPEARFSYDFSPISMRVVCDVMHIYIKAP